MPRPDLAPAQTFWAHSPLTPPSCRSRGRSAFLEITFIALFLPETKGHSVEESPSCSSARREQQHTPAVFPWRTAADVVRPASEIAGGENGY